MSCKIKEGNQMLINQEFKRLNSCYNKERNKLKIKEIKEGIMRSKLGSWKMRLMNKEESQVLIKRRSENLSKSKTRKRDFYKITTRDIKTK